MQVPKSNQLAAPLHDRLHNGIILALQCIIFLECSTSPLAHLDLVMQEVYLPLMTSPSSSSSLSGMNDQLLDLLHRISSSMQITHGYSQVSVYYIRAFKILLHVRMILKL